MEEEAEAEAEVEGGGDERVEFVAGHGVASDPLMVFSLEMHCAGVLTRKSKGICSERKDMFGFMTVLVFNFYAYKDDLPRIETDLRIHIQN